MRTGVAAALALAAGMALLAAVAAVLVFPPAPPQQQAQAPALEIRIIGGEISASGYGFALEGGELSSPGPTLRVKAGETVRIIFENTGEIPHSFVITSEAREGAEPLLGSIGSPARPIPPGEAGSLVFTPRQPGRYAYVCNVPGHVTLGMYGEFIVEE